jgi:hypothetical protein
MDSMQNIRVNHHQSRFHVEAIETGVATATMEQTSEALAMESFVLRFASGTEDRITS